MSAQRLTSKVPTDGTRSLLIIVTPGTRSTEQFEARLNGRQPFFEAARVLMAEGVDPSTILVMRHSGSQTDCLRAPLAVAAGFTVEETKYGPRVRRWKPLLALAVSPRIASIDGVATPIAAKRQKRVEQATSGEELSAGKNRERRSQKLNTEAGGS